MVRPDRGDSRKMLRPFYTAYRPALHSAIDGGENSPENKTGAEAPVYFAAIKA